MNIVENLDYLDVSIILHIYSCKCFSYMKLPTNVFLRWHYQGPEGNIYRVLNMFFRPAHNFFWFYIGLPFLAHRCITMRRWVAYIHDPDMTLNFDLKVKFIGFLTCFCVRPITFFWFYIGLPYKAHGCLTMRRCVAYIHEPDSTFTFDLKVIFIGFCRVFMYYL